MSRERNRGTPRKLPTIPKSQVTVSRAMAGIRTLAERRERELAVSCNALDHTSIGTGPAVVRLGWVAIGNGGLKVNYVGMIREYYD